MTFPLHAAHPSSNQGARAYWQLIEGRLGLLVSAMSCLKKIVVYGQVSKTATIGAEYTPRSHGKTKRSGTAWPRQEVSDGEYPYCPSNSDTERGRPMDSPERCHAVLQQGVVCRELQAVLANSQLWCVFHLRPPPVLSHKHV